MPKIEQSLNELFIMDIKFTRRQEEVIECLLLGMTNKDIAKELSISENTVEYHLKRIYSKLGIHSRVKVVSYLSLSERGKTTDFRS